MAKKILVVEDNPETFEMVRLGLEQPGFEIISASNGNEGIEKATTNQPDIILLDIMLPDISGYDVCQTLKNDDRTKHIPVIILTGIGSFRDKYVSMREEAVKSGADDYIAKPFEIDVLVKKIKRFI